MFIWQKLEYKKIFLNEDSDFKYLQNSYRDLKPKIVAWDTETTGLHILKDKPFLIGIGFNKFVYIYEPTKERNEIVFNLLLEHKPDYYIAHNAKFDYHMMRNIGSPIPKEINIADTYSLARLTDYVDSLDSLSLISLGAQHVSPNAKFANEFIKAHLKTLNKDRYANIKEYVKNNIKNITYTMFRDMYKKRVQFVKTEYDEHFDKVDELYPEINYESSYKDNPNAMINYLTDDVVLVLEVFNKLITILDKVDKDRVTWHRENKLIRVVGDFEINGLSIDVNYILKQRLVVYDYMEKTYDKLHSLVGKKFTVGQHKVIKDIFRNKFRIGMVKTDEDALDEIIDNYDGEAVEVAKLIVELRTVDKWISTYINGMLNRVVGDKIYTDINNSGTNTGRVSSDMQQQPKKALYSRDGIELYHPRKPFIAEEGHTNFYIDFKNMEMRVQAFYTMLVSTGDLQMCRAFIPFKCIHMLTGEMYDPVKDIDDWDSGEWLVEDYTVWEPTDLHSATTFKAFPEIKEDDHNFDEYRELGKRANFLKNYGGGKRTLMKSLKVNESVAEALNKGYYKAFPKVIDYQNWVDTQIRTYGNVKNLYGRSYYFQNTAYSYRGYNYLVQGTCADYVKNKEIEIDKFLEPYESKMLLPIHDEIVFSIKKGEEHILDGIQKIMNDSKSIMPTIPMLGDISVTYTNWAEKRDYNGS